MPFQCAICGEESTRICARCTKDACSNHLCDRCHRCSDCCDCEVALSEPMHEPVRTMLRGGAPTPPTVHAAEPPVHYVEPVDGSNAWVEGPAAEERESEESET